MGVVRYQEKRIAQEATTVADEHLQKSTALPPAFAKPNLPPIVNSQNEIKESPTALGRLRQRMIEPFIEHSPKIIESFVLLLGFSATKLSDFVTLGKFRNKIYAVEESLLEKVQSFSNKYTKAGSIVNDLAKEQSWFQTAKHFNFLAHASEAIIMPLLSSTYWLWQEGARGSMNLARPIVNYLYGENLAFVTYENFKKLEETDNLLKYSRASFEIAEIMLGFAAAISSGGTVSEPLLLKSSKLVKFLKFIKQDKLANSLGNFIAKEASSIKTLRRLSITTSSMSLASSMGERMLAGKELNAMEILADTRSGMAHSASFMGVFSKLGHVYTPLRKLVDTEVNAAQIAKEVAAIREVVDFGDGFGDFVDTLLDVERTCLYDKNLSSLEKTKRLTGWVLKLGSASFDTFDINFALKTKTKQHSVAENTLAQKTEYNFGGGITAEGHLWAKGKILFLDSKAEVRKLHNQLTGLPSENYWGFKIHSNNLAVVPRLDHSAPRIARIISTSFVLHEYLHTEGYSDEEVIQKQALYLAKHGIEMRFNTHTYAIVKVNTEPIIPSNQNVSSFLNTRREYANNYSRSTAAAVDPRIAIASETKDAINKLSVACKSNDHTKIRTELEKLPDETRRILTTNEYLKNYLDLSSEDRACVDQAMMALEMIEAIVSKILGGKKEKQQNAYALTKALWNEEEKGLNHADMLHAILLKQKIRETKGKNYEEVINCFFNAKKFDEILQGLDLNQLRNLLAVIIQSPSTENITKLRNLYLKEINHNAIYIEHVPPFFLSCLDLAVQVWFQTTDISKIENLRKNILESKGIPPAKSLIVRGSAKSVIPEKVFPELLRRRSIDGSIEELCTKLAKEKRLSLFSNALLLLEIITTADFTPETIASKNYILSTEEAASLNIYNSTNPLAQLIVFLIKSKQFSELKRLLDVHIMSADKLSTFLLQTIFDLLSSKDYQLVEELVRAHYCPLAIVHAVVETFILQSSFARLVQYHQILKLKLKLAEESSRHQKPGSFEALDIRGKNLLLNISTEPNQALNEITHISVTTTICILLDPVSGIVKPENADVYTLTNCEESIVVALSEDNPVDIGRDIGSSLLDPLVIINHILADKEGKTYGRANFSLLSSVYSFPSLDPVLQELEECRRKTLEVLKKFERNPKDGVRDLVKNGYLNLTEEKLDSEAELTSQEINDYRNCIIAQIIFANQYLLYLNLRYDRLSSKAQGWARGLYLQNQAWLDLLPAVELWHPQTRELWNNLVVDLEGIDQGVLMPTGDAGLLPPGKEGALHSRAKTIPRHEYSRLRNLMRLPGFIQFLYLDGRESKHGNPNRYVAAQFELSNSSVDGICLFVLETDVVDNATYLIACTLKEWEIIRVLGKPRLRSLNNKQPAGAENARFLGKIDHEHFDESDLTNSDETQRPYLLELRRALISAGVKLENTNEEVTTTPANENTTPKQTFLRAEDWQKRNFESVVANLRRCARRFQGSAEITQAINDLAKRLRSTLCNDPIFRELGVKVPEKFEAVILESPEPLACVVPTHPDVFFISIGMIELMEQDLGCIAAISSHEQAHIILDQLTALRGERTKERYGETIWLDPWNTALAYEPENLALERFFSQRVEYFCDTYGALPILYLAGLSPFATSRAFSKLLKVGRRRDDFDMGAEHQLKNILRSHPPTGFRREIISAVLAQFGYPKLTRNESPETGIIALEYSEDLVSKKVARIIFEHTNILAWLLCVFNNNSFDNDVDDCGDSYLPISYRDSLLNDSFFSIFKELSAEEQTRVLHILISFLYFANSLAGISKEKNESRNEDNSSDEKKFFKIFSVEQRRKKVKVSDLKHLYADCPGRDINSTKFLTDLLFKKIAEAFASIASEIKSTEAKNISPFLSTNTSESPQLMSEEELIDCIGNFPELINMGQAFIQELVRQMTEEKSMMYYFDVEATPTIVRIRQISLRKKIGTLIKKYFENDSPINSLATFDLLPEAKSFLKKQISNKNKKLPKDAKGFCQALVNIRKASTVNPCSPFALIDEETLFNIAIVYIMGLPRKKQAKYLRELKEQGFAPTFSYSKAKIRTYNNSDDKLVTFAFEHTVNEKPLFDLIKELWPSYADFLLLQHLSIRDLNQDLLLKMTEPIAFGLSIGEESFDRARFSEKTVVNLHDKWAEKKADKLLLRGNDNIHVFLEKLDQLPCLFSAIKWKEIVAESVHELADLLDLFDFFMKKFEDIESEETPWRSSNRTLGAIAILEIGLDKLINEQKIKWADVTSREKILSMVRRIPRTPFRNNLLLKVLQLYQGSYSRDEILDLARRIETEPYETMFQQITEELRNSSNSDFLILEQLMQRCQRSFVSENAYLSQRMVTDAEGQTIRADEATEDEFYGNFGRFANNMAEVNCVYFMNIDPKKVSSSSKRVGSLLQRSKIIEIPSTLRYQLCKMLTASETKPTKPLVLKSESMRCAEDAGILVLKLLGENDPNTTNPFLGKNNLSSEDFFGYLENLILLAQAAPTPLRDSWIINTLKHFEESCPILTKEELKKIQSKLFLPENIEQLGLKIWEKIKGEILVGQVSIADLLTEFREVLPFYSSSRNQVLAELRQLVHSYDYNDARRLSLLYWEPGLPTPIPSKVTLAAESILDFQLTILRNFEDDQIVDFLLYALGISEHQPWSVDYMEYGFGCSFDNLITSTSQLNNSQRRSLIHELFGGSTGLFARNDVYALKQLAKQIAGYISISLNLNEISSQLLEEIAYDLFFRAEFSVKFRTDLLSNLFEWANKQKQGAVISDQIIAELLLDIAKVAGAVGFRILQGIIIEPRMLPENLKEHLRKVQHQVEYGSAHAPFHAAAADGVKDLVISHPKGAGSMAEVHTVVSIDGKNISNGVGKFSRAGNVYIIELLRAPLLKLAQTIHQFNPAWGERTINIIVNSCIREIEEFSMEAARTGVPVANVIATALSGSAMNEAEKSICIDYNLSGRPQKILIPQRIARGTNSANFFFLMTNMGRFETTAAADEKRRSSQIELADYYSQRGAAITDLADSMVLIFFNSFIDSNVLFCDAHFGNSGVVLSANEKLEAYGFLDFGSAWENFPTYWKNWIFRLCFHAASQDWSQLRSDLIEAKYFAEEKTRASLDSGDPKLLKLETIIDQIKDVVAHISPESGFAAIIDTVKNLLGFLYQDWPLPPEITVFCEALRKLEREWRPYVSSQTWTLLGEKILRSAIQIMSSDTAGVKPDPGFMELFNEAQTQANKTEDDFYQEAENSPALDYINDLGEIPQGSKFVIWQDDQWYSHTLLENLLSGKRSIRYGMSGTMVNPNMKGYFEVSDRDGKIYRISIAKFING